MTDRSLSDEQSPSTDPVQKLLRSARDEAIDESFHVTGVMMQYYEVCERELWFASRHLEIDRDNAAVVRGTRVDDTAYEEKRRNVSVDGTIAIDVLDDGRVMEVKPSSSLVEPAKLQLLYYLEGVIELFSHRDDRASRIVSAFVVGDSDDEAKTQSEEHLRSCVDAASGVGSPEAAVLH